jgi:hypothetical protein
MIAFNVAARHWKCAKMGISVKVVRCILCDVYISCSQVIEMRNSVVKYCLPETEQWIAKREIQLFFTCY